MRRSRPMVWGPAPTAAAPCPPPSGYATFCNLTDGVEVGIKKWISNIIMHKYNWNKELHKTIDMDSGVV